MLHLGRQLYFRSADKLSLPILIRLRMCRTAGLLIGKYAGYPIRMLRDKPFNTVFASRSGARTITRPSRVTCTASVLRLERTSSYSIISLSLALQIAVVEEHRDRNAADQ